MGRQIEGLEANVPKILKAVSAILDEVAGRVDVTSDIKVYECKDVIRIDLKIKKEE